MHQKIFVTSKKRKFVTPKVEAMKTDKFYKNLKPKDKEYLEKDNTPNLYLRVMPTGSKSWLFIFVNPNTGKRARAGLGSYSKISLQLARSKAKEYQELLANGVNPISHFKALEAQRQIRNANLFQDVFKKWADVSFTHLQENTSKRKKLDIEKYAYPFLKDKPILQITKGDLVELIEARARASAVRANRLFRMLDNIFKFALQKDFISINPCDKINLNNLITIPKTKHFKAITDARELQELVKNIYNNKSFESVSNALIFVLHAPLRIANLVSLEWEQIDFEAKLLTIPRNKMKVKNPNLPDFQLPLNDEAIKVLKKQQDFYLKSEKYVFVSKVDFKKHIAIGTLEKAINRLSDKQTIHSFRQTFRTIAEAHKMEHKGSFEALESALDHHARNSTQIAYLNKAQYLKELENVMKWWSSFIVNLKNKE